MQTRRISLAVTALMFVLGALLLVVTKRSALASGDLITRVSVASDGTQGNGDSGGAEMSGDERYIVFSSEATNLVPDDTNGFLDIFVHDRDTGETTRVSVNSDGIQGDNSSWYPAISWDGRHIAFISNATNLVPNDTNGHTDVFVHDQVTGETTRVSIASNGDEANDHCVSSSAISSDGRYVAFACPASNLVPGDTNGWYDVFLHDRETGETELVSVNSAGVQGNHNSLMPVLSSDARYISFMSISTNLAPNDSNGSADIFVHDRVTGETRRVSVSSANVQGNDTSGAPAISRNGRYVVFESSATTLDPDSKNPANSGPDIFLHDRETGITEQVSVSQDGTGGEGPSWAPVVSDDGRYVTFYSRAPNLIPDGSSPIYYQVFVKDRQTDRMIRASVTVTGAPAEDGMPSSISSDGRYVMFTSGSDDLVSDDTNEVRDVFVYDGADRLPPSSELEPLSATSTEEIPLSWSGADDESGGIFVSGVATYDVQVRVGSTGEWVPVLTGTTQTSTVYNGEAGHTYYFRVRATDVAGNAEAWPETYDATTRVPNVFTGTLNVPSGWITTQTPAISFSGTSAGDPVEAASLSNDGTTWGAWTPITPGTTVTTTWDFESDGADLPLYLRLRDGYGDVGLVVTETVNVDTVNPLSTISELPEHAPAAISLEWSGNDATSGVAHYDVEVREGAAGAWSALLTNTSSTTAVYSGTNGTTYYFRVRATDVAGNVEAWPATHDASTTVDTGAPTGTLSINGGALATAATTVELGLSAEDALSAVSDMRFSDDGEEWDTWQAYDDAATFALPANDGMRTVYAQFRDEVGNLSAPVSDTIELDQAASTERLFSIDGGAQWTNVPTVTLTIGAPAGTTVMQISNDRGFPGAKWQPFDTRPTWQIVPYGSDDPLTYSVYVRVRDESGEPSEYHYSDTIIYDPLPPTGSTEIDSVTETSVRVRLSASDAHDYASGVAEMRVGLADSFGQATWQPYATTRTLPLNGASADEVEVCAQFRDGAGNTSARVCTANAGEWFVYLPLIGRQTD